MANIVHPRGRLEKREGDINLLPKHYLQLSLFAGLKKPPTKEFYGYEALFMDDSGNWFSLGEKKSITN